MARPRSFGTGYQDARGNWWSDYTDESGNTSKVAVTGPQTTWGEGNTVYNQMSPTGNERGGFSQNYLPSDAWRWQSGATLTPEEFQNFYKTLASPKVSNDFGSLTAQQYLNDPRSLIRQENGQYVYRPEMQQGDFNPIPQDHSFGSLAKGFLSSPGIALMGAGIGAGSALNSFFPGLGQAAGPGLLETGSSLSPYGTFNPTTNTINPFNTLAQTNQFVPSTMTDVPYYDAPVDWGSATGGATSSTGDFASSFNPTSTLPNVPSPATFGPLSPIDEMISSISGGGQLLTGDLGNLGTGLATTAAGAGLPLGDITNVLQTGSTAASVADRASGRNTNAETISAILKDLGIGITPAALGLLGTGLATGLGAYAANQQQNSAEKLAQQYMDMGAPYRNALSDLVSNPGNFYGSPMVQGALDQGTSALARSLSAKVGNPILNPGALQQMQTYTTRGLLDQYNNQFRNLAAAGGLGVSQASQLGTNAIAAQGGAPNAIGSGLASLFNNQPDYSGIIADLFRANGGLGRTYLGGY